MSVELGLGQAAAVPNSAITAVANTLDLINLTGEPGWIRHVTTIEIPFLWKGGEWVRLSSEEAVPYTAVSICSDSGGDPGWCNTENDWATFCADLMEQLDYCV